MSHHLVLHELTHLDALGKLAGLDADGDNRHGTGDSQADCELTGARKLLTGYINNPKVDTGSPDYNAESYAAAATEIYFMDLCDFSRIKP